MTQRLHITELTSIGAVAEPDNPEAHILFWKRAFTSDQREQMAQRGEAMSDGSFPIANVADLRNAIQASGRAKNPAAVKRHIIRRARALGQTDLLPEGWAKSTEPREGRNEGGSVSKIDLSHLDDQDREAIEKVIADLEAQVAELTVEEEPPLPDDLPEAVVKALSERDTAIAKAQAEATAAKAEADRLREERLTEKYEARAAELANLLGPVDEMARVLKALATADGDAFAKLDEKFDTLIAADSLDALMKEHGSASAGGSAVDQAHAKAEELRKANPDLTVAEARAKVWEENPDLYQASIEEGVS